MRVRTLVPAQDVVMCLYFPTSIFFAVHLWFLTNAVLSCLLCCSEFHTLSRILAVTAPWLTRLKRVSVADPSLAHLTCVHWRVCVQLFGSLTNSTCASKWWKIITFMTRIAAIIIHGRAPFTCNLWSNVFILDPKSKYQPLFGFHGKEGWRGGGTSDLPWHDGKPGDVITICTMMQDLL